MKVLVVIDMQKDFVDGALGTSEAQAIVPNVVAKVKQYAEMEDAVILYTRDTHYGNYMDTMEGKYLPVPHCIRGTEGWHIVPEVYVEGGRSWIADKITFGYYDIGGMVRRALARFSEEEDLLPDSIEICGLCTSICVISNALILKSHYPETPLIVDSKCCACISKETHEAALLVMKTCQIEVVE